MRHDSMSRVLALAILVCGAWACRGQAPQNPAASELSWKTYADPVLGFEFEYPEVYELQPDENGVLLRFEGYPVVCVRWCGEGACEGRGLWHGHEPVESIELGGRAGDRYVYRHHDGPFYMRTVSYVVPHRGRTFGLEFRTDSDTPDSVQQRILGSIRFEPS